MPLAPAALEPLLRLALVPGIGPGRLSALLGRFGSAERVLGAGAEQVAALPGFGAELVPRVLSASSADALARARAAREAMERVGAVALSPDDLAYPASFRALPDAPYLLFAAGDLSLLERPSVGVVGTRSPTAYGRGAAAQLAGELARAGYGITSGMAKGIDAVAHAAALDAGGATVGVLGHGIDVVYPAENRRLFERVRGQGVLVSALAPGEEPRAGNFPRRNRLIAALSLGVLVVEMGEKSGARHTVEYALEQGKDVFAVPGPIGSPMSAGTNQLLKEGARVVTSAQDILEELQGVGTVGVAPSASARPPSATSVDLAAGSSSSTATMTVEAPAGLAPEEAQVFAALTAEARQVDELAVQAGLAPSRVLAALLGLELRDLAEQLPGKHFRRR